MFKIDLVEALLNGTFKLIGDLTVSVSVEDSPLHHFRLCEHFGLYLSIELSRTLLDVHFVWSTRACRSHDKVSSIIFVSNRLDRHFLELDMPVLRFFFAPIISSERLEQIGALFYLLLSSGLNNLCEIFHEPKI